MDDRLKRFGSRRRHRPGYSSGTAAVLALVFSLLAAGIAHAEGWGYDLGGELMSPFCPGRTLSSCPSPQAAELVQWIVTQEAAGATREEVIDILIERFGEEILGAPPAEGITLWAYVFPIAGFMGGGGIAALVLRRIVGRSRDDDDGDQNGDQDRSPPLAGVSTPQSDADLARIVDEELAGRG